MEVENINANFDYQFFVIGGGSGGLSAARTAGSYGIKTAIADFVKPSPYGSKWGLGGTCVNVGCIPKKLMHYAATLGEQRKEQQAVGWEIDLNSKHSWQNMVSKVQAHIKGTNYGYRTALIKDEIKYYNAYASFIDQNTIKLEYANGKVEQVTAQYVLIAVGGRPVIPENIKAKNLVITSDDIFALKQNPGKTLAIGASYVALECAGFLTALGCDTTIMVRSILLRGFDQEMANKIGKYMEKHGTKFINENVPIDVEKLENGKLLVTYQNVRDTNVVQKEEFDTVFFATGRYPQTEALNLQAIGIKLDLSGKIVTDEKEQTNISNIFCIGDASSGKLELTPPAIAAGRLLVERLFMGSQKLMDYQNIATTVFTPIEYGCIGLSEEDAIKKFGDENIEIYHTHFKPLEWNYNEENDAETCYTKLIVNMKDNNRVVGFHYLGPNAGEVTQGFAVAFKLNATIEHFQDTIGIHPTCAEEIVDLKKTKRTDPNAQKQGC